MLQTCSKNVANTRSARGPSALMGRAAPTHQGGWQGTQSDMLIESTTAARCCMRSVLIGGRIWSSSISSMVQSPSTSRINIYPDLPIFWPMYLLYLLNVPGLYKSSALIFREAIRLYHSFSPSTTSVIVLQTSPSPVVSSTTPLIAIQSTFTYLSTF